MVFYSSHPDGFALFMLAILFLFHMHLCTIINNRRGLSTCKNGKAAHSLVMLPPSWAVLYCCFSIFVWVLRWRLDWDQNQLSLDRPRVASWLWSLPNMIAWIERCFFGFLDSPGVFFVLAMTGIVDWTFYCLPVASLCPVPFPFCGHGMAVLLSSGWDSTEWDHHIFFLLL